MGFKEIISVWFY